MTQMAQAINCGQHTAVAWAPLVGDNRGSPRRTCSPKQCPPVPISNPPRGHLGTSPPRLGQPIITCASCAHCLQGLPPVRFQTKPRRPTADDSCSWPALLSAPDVRVCRPTTALAKAESPLHTPLHTIPTAEANPERRNSPSRLTLPSIAIAGRRDIATTWLHTR
ncbi:hypothetical protein BKA66DRAFT_444769 [Pyrenochaeta sp. MPI-SDFR-AT-0127]|nr:hypothetical protein BKA66DRAFT_444769 [Pyrenochaeta sp. MPI-SDFR-AT-0127]